MTLSERFALLKKAAPLQTGQKGVQKQVTPNKQGKGQGNQGKAQANGGNTSNKAGGKKGKKGRGKKVQAVDHATLDKQLETHMAEGGDAATAH
jgi:hypothetical protein